MEEQQYAEGTSSGSGQHAAHHAEQQQLQQQQQVLTAQAGPARSRHPYSDEFMMYVWKVEMCRRVDKHDREQCPYAHPGELARRRHPSLYQALPCPEARAKKICPRLEKCNCSHSTFEFWLHPDRYKTFLCERGEGCNRPICFFAHTPDELRELPLGLQRTQTLPRPDTSATDASTAGSTQQGGAAAGQHASTAGSWPAGSELIHENSGSSTLPDAGGSWSGQQRPGQQGATSSSAQQGPGAPRAHSSAHGSMMMVYQPGMQAAGPACSPAGTMLPSRSEAHRGATVAVIPAGPTVWQNNPLLQTDDGEAPNLEQLCAAVTRVGLQSGHRADGLSLQQQAASVQQQQVQQPAGAGPTGMMVSPYPAATMMAPQQGALMPVPYLAFQTQQQPQAQPMMLPGGQLVYVQVPPAQGDGTSADQLPWVAMQPGG